MLGRRKKIKGGGKGVVEYCEGRGGGKGVVVGSEKGKIASCFAVPLVGGVYDRGEAVN